MSQMAEDQIKSQRTILERVFGEGAASGINVEEWSAARSTLREGRILRIAGALHSDKDRARDALGAITSALRD